MNVEEWLVAFALTHAIEIPVWWFASRELSGWRRLAVVLGPSTLTHPVVWFAFPWDAWPYLPTVLLAETFAVVAEALYVRWLGVEHPWRWSLAANAASWGIGTLVILGFGAAF